MIWRDGGYAGQLVEWVAQIFRPAPRLEIVPRLEVQQHEFTVLKWRWIVERIYVRLARTLQALIEGLRETPGDGRELDPCGDDERDAPSSGSSVGTHSSILLNSRRVELMLSSDRHVALPHRSPFGLDQT